MYNFSKLRQLLDELGFPSATSSLFQVIKRDLTEEEDKGNIEYNEDGIFYTLDGVKYKGYLYLKVPDIRAYGHPKFHVVECQTIREQKRMGRFRNRYFWHNNNVVVLHDRESGIIYEDVVLSICQHCRRQIAQKHILTTQDFFDQFEVEETIDETVKTGIGGYVLDWRNISAIYRESKSYQCEKCAVKVDSNSDKRFIHVHHRDGNKLNNRQTNLEALCVLCHSHVDAGHERNFGKYVKRFITKSFVKKYFQSLKECGNVYVDGFIESYGDDTRLS